MKQDNRESDRKFAGGLTVMSIAVALVCLGASSIELPESAPYVFIFLGLICYFFGFRWFKQPRRNK